ncbi:ABC transporter substrate-binding protein [Thalassotalea insulae]|uniref:ABC transporter substrate-binding protein n=1 Tax=Thalassotalea insulae TaxID=2056778 RepID=A0ABQ6H190_9GAMM|nr:ABC transporter substrate-binding protein [Thalassotalea insulae]GLX80196.1 ABC transporter substrate-binding protein [Thalassotalea insulae]
MTNNDPLHTKKQRPKLLALFIVSMSWCLFCQAAEQKLTSIEIITGEYPPAISQQAPDNGYVARLVSDAFALADIKTTFTFRPWARGIRMVRLGNNPVIMYYGKTQERLDSFYFSDPLFQEQWFLFHLKSTRVNWQKLIDLSRFKIGATLSYSYTKEFHDLADKNVLNVNWVSRDEQNWHMLMAGHIDIYPATNAGWYQLNKLYSKEAVDLITTHPSPFLTHLAYLLFSKRHPQGKYLRDQFNKGFAKLKQLHPLSYYIPNSENQSWPSEPIN